MPAGQRKEETEGKEMAYTSRSNSRRMDREIQKDLENFRLVSVTTFKEIIKFIYVENLLDK